MSSAETCRFGGRKKANGNCERPDADGFALQSVGPWVSEKHEQLHRYLEATHAVRAKFSERAGAAYVDLFAGPGRVRVRDREATQEGSALLAVQHRQAPFSKLVLCDIEPENVSALRARTAGDSRVVVIGGDCNEQIDRVVREIPADGLNIALIDPFGARPLKWATVEKLARFKRMDLLIHFPTMAIKRNFLNKSAAHFSDVIDEVVGGDSWRERVHKHGDVVALIEVMRERLVPFGYDPERVSSVAIKNTQGGLLYHLVFASKDKLGTKIWKSLTRHSGRQRGLAF